MEFEKMKRHVTFDNEGGKDELVGVKSERLTTTEDMAAMQKFADAETDKLSDVVEQSSDPEKGEKINRFKKALKGLTVGVTLMAATLGGFDNARATDIGDFVKDASAYGQMTNTSELLDMNADKDSTLEQTITSQHENIKGLEKLKKENAKLEIARDELEKNAIKLASIDQDMSWYFVDNMHEMVVQGHLSQEDYDKWFNKFEQRQTESDAKFEKKMQQQRVEFEKGREARDKRAQEVVRLAEQKTLADAQEYNELLNDEVDALLEIIVNL